jgi:hypothetical protein
VNGKPVVSLCAKPREQEIELGSLILKIYRAGAEAAARAAAAEAEAETRRAKF